MEQTRFVYIRDERGHPVGCVAYRLAAGSPDGGCLMEFAVSCHNPTDRFSRVVARRVAQGRLDVSPMRAHGPDAQTTMRAALTHLIDTDDRGHQRVSTRVCRGIRRFLGQEDLREA